MNDWPCDSREGRNFNAQMQVSHVHKPSAMQVPNVMKEVALMLTTENAPINNTALHITDDNHVS